MDFPCPVCGYLFDTPAWDGEEASFDICQCYSIQYGYDDCCGGDAAARVEFWRAARLQWIAEGMP
jgi:hypothetical protein